MLHKRVHQESIKNRESDPVYGGRSLSHDALANKNEPTINRTEIHVEIS